MYIWETEEETPEKSGRPQLKSPVWLDLLPAPPENPTKRRVKKMSKAMKPSTTIATVERSMPATVLASRGEKLPKISVSEAVSEAVSEEVWVDEMTLVGRRVLISRD